MPNQCCICGGRQHTFTMPKHEPARAAWQRALFGHGVPAGRETYHVCYKHFTRADIKAPNQRLRLMKDAVPSVFADTANDGLNLTMLRYKRMELQPSDCDPGQARSSPQPSVADGAHSGVPLTVMEMTDLTVLLPVPRDNDSQAVDEIIESRPDLESCACGMQAPTSYIVESLTGFQLLRFYQDIFGDGFRTILPQLEDSPPPLTDGVTDAGLTHLMNDPDPLTGVARKTCQQLDFLSVARGTTVLHHLRKGGNMAPNALLEDDNKFGFIIMDGNGALFGTLSGNTREVLHKFTVDLPEKHGRGGQSALHFERLRMEKRHNYVRKVAETAVQMFIANDKVNVAGFILAGSADFKNELGQSDMFDQRLQARIIKVVDISYGGENGFNQAIELAADTLANVKFIQEKKLIDKYFDEISQDTGRYCFGVADTLKALEMGAVEILIVWENMEVTRYLLKDPVTEVEKILFLKPEQEKDKSNFTDKETGVELEMLESMPLIEWFANHYKEFGAVLEIITDKSQEGAQFVKGFGGMGGILRYQVDFQQLEAFEENLVEFDFDDYD